MDSGRRLPVWARYGLALLGVAVVTGLIAALGRFHLANASMLQLIVVLIAAVALGRGPAIVAAFAAFLASNFFLVEPRLTLAVANPEELITLMLLLLTAIVTGTVAADQHRRAEEAEGHARQARLLYEVALLMAEPNVTRALESVAAHLRSELGVAAIRIEIVRPSGSTLESVGAGEADAMQALKTAAAGTAEVLQGGARGGGDRQPRAGRWMRVSPPHRAGRQPIPYRVLRVPIRGPHGDAGEVSLAATRGRELDSASVQLLESLSAQLWVAVERARLREAATDAEVLRRTDEAKSALLDAVSHDLRTPLASIIASAGSLRQTDVVWSDDEHEAFAAGIEQEAQRLDRIVGNLLDLSRIRGGTLQPDRGWYEPTSLIRDVVDRLRPSIDPHPLRLDLPEELPPMLLDYSELDQVLSNLVENAAKYSPPDGEIGISAAVSNGTLRVSVSDRGPGISDEALPQLFEPFFRAAGARRAHGIGLGLAVARGLVEAHGGRIWAENDVRGGARFSFDIPTGANG